MREYTRREILAAFLGAPALLSGCGPSALPPLPPGKIVGASHEFGHKLRDGKFPLPAADDWTDRRIVIVGGGVAGLSAAWRLIRAGVKDFVLLELESAAGGTSRSGQSNVSAFPWGAHYIPAPLQNNTALMTLLDEIGIMETDLHGNRVVAEQFLCRDPQERLFYKGAWYEGLYLRAGADAEDLRQFAAFKQEIDRWIDWRDGQGRRAFVVPVGDASDDSVVRELDRISMAEFIERRGWKSPRLRWYVDYACRDDYGLSITDTSAWAGLFYYASRVSKAGQEAQPLVTWPEGNGRLVNHLHKSVEANVKLGTCAVEINPIERDGRSWIEVSAMEQSSNRMIGYRAEKVIFAAPQFMARYLIRPFKEIPPVHLRDFEYGAWMVANLTLSEHPSGRGYPLCWDNVFYESPSLGYVVATHQTEIDRGPTVLTYYYPLCDNDGRAARARLLGADWPAWAETALSDVSRAHPGIRSQVQRLDVMRWGHAMIRPKPGFVWSNSRQAARQPFRSIHFAHSDLSGVALFEEAFYHGVRAAAEVMG